MQITYIREEIERRRRQILQQRREIRDLQRAGIPQSPRKSCWPGCKPRSMSCAQNATGCWANRIKTVRAGDRQHSSRYRPPSQDQRLGSAGYQ